jgi:hypothetical protein
MRGEWPFGVIFEGTRNLLVPSVAHVLDKHVTRRDRQEPAANIERGL